MAENYKDFGHIEHTSVFEQMSDAVLTIDEHDTITYLNPAAQRIFGLVPEEVLHQNRNATLTHNKKNKAFNQLITHSQQSLHTSDSGVVTYDNGTSKKVLSIRINPYEEAAPEESGKKHLKKDTEKRELILLAEDITATHNLKNYERDCATIFAGLIFCLCIYLSVWSLLEFTLQLHLSTEIYTKMIEGIAFLLFIEILVLTSLTPGDIGIFVRPAGFIRTLWKAVLTSLIVCLILVAVNAILRVSGHPVKPYFIGGSWAGATSYIATAILQEFLSRGVIQTSIKSMMRIRFQKFFSIFLTSLLFMLMHLPFGFPFMVCAFVMSAALGIIYERDENIWGCAFLHWSCGYLAMALFF